MLKTSGKNTKDYRKVFLAYIEPLKKKKEVFLKYFSFVKTTI